MAEKYKKIVLVEFERLGKINFHKIFFLVVDFRLLWTKIIFARIDVCVISV